MKSRVGAPILFALALFLLSATALAQIGRIDPARQAPTVSASSPQAASPSEQPIATGDEIFPMAAPGCFLNCVRSCSAQCNTLPPDLIQQCSSDCAEACRCLCGVCN